MSIAIVGPAKFDFQDLACIELMLRFEGRPGATMLVELNEGEDAELSLPSGTAEPLIVEVQVKGASGAVTIDDLAAFLAHCPARDATNTLFERLIASPNKVALLIMSGRCDDMASSFVVPFDWNGVPPAAHIKDATATAFLAAFGNIPAASATSLMVRRKQNRDRMASATSLDVARNALDRVLVFERVRDAELEIACSQHLARNFRIPNDRIFDTINHLRNAVKNAKTDQTDAIPPMREIVQKNAPVSLRPEGYIERGIETQLSEKLSAERCLLLSGQPRCGKSDAARWIAAGFEQIGYDVQQGSDFDTASRFLSDPSHIERLFVLDDPLGGAHPDPECGRTLERLGNLIARLPTHRKIVVAQSQDIIFLAVGSADLSACKVAGHAWVDLSQYRPEFLSQLWNEMASATNVPAPLKDRMAEALSQSAVVLEPGCLQHLASSGGSLSDQTTLDQAIRIAREPAKTLGQSLATDAPMANLLAALAIGTAANNPTDVRDLAFAMDTQDASLPGKIISRFEIWQLGGDAVETAAPEYGKIPALDSQAGANLETLERRGIVAFKSSEVVDFSHPYYRAAAESILATPTTRVAGEAVRIVERSLFCLAPATSRAAARNLDWLHLGLSNKVDEQQKLILIAIDGLRSRFPVTRDICFLFLVRHLSYSSGKLSRELPGWTRSIAHVSLDDVRWENGEAVFPSEDTVDAGEWFNRSFAKIDEEEVVAELTTLESDQASYLSPERAAKALAYLKLEPEKLSLRAMNRFLSYNEAIIRAEATRIWLLRNRNDDAAILSRIFEDSSPVVIVRLLSGACAGWDGLAADRKEIIIRGLQLAAANPFSALLLLDQLVIFNRVEHYGEKPPWPLFEALMPIVLKVLPAEANISEPRLYSVMRDASQILSAAAAIPILASWISWIERDLSRGILPDEYALGLSDVLFAITKNEPSLRSDLVKRLFALPGTGASMVILRDFVDEWTILEPEERALIIEAITADRPDRLLLRALVLTRADVPPELQQVILGNPSALAAEPGQLLRELPADLISAAVAVYCGRPQPLWWIGTHHPQSEIWEKIVRQIALQPDHPQFDAALADVIFQSDAAAVAAAIKNAGPQDLQKLFEILLQQRIDWTGNYLSEAWEALFRCATDDSVKNDWLDRMAEVAPIMLDEVGEITDWLTGDAESEALFRRMKTDIAPLELLFRLKELSADARETVRATVAEALKQLLTNAPPRLFGTYDHIRRDCEQVGIDDLEVFELLTTGRAKIFTDRDKFGKDNDQIDPRPEGWIEP